jgi:hypothetical protein
MQDLRVLALTFSASTARIFAVPKRARRAALFR